MKSSSLAPSRIGEARQPPHGEGKALRVEGIAGQEVEPLPLHRATAPTGHAPHPDVEVDEQVAADQVADAALLAVVPPALHPAAGSG